MSTTIITAGACQFELLRGPRDADAFRGVGRVWIEATLVRSGRLPWRVYTQSFCGQELFALHLRAVEQSDAQVVLRLLARFRPLPVKLLRDHSFDPIHELGDWDQPVVSAQAELDLVLRPTRAAWGGYDFTGFSYHWEYRGPAPALFYLLDQSSWELDGDVAGATVVSQSACSAPVATFAPDTAWSTEGKLDFLVEQGDPAPVMTHNLPRWASHGAFDFQYRGDHTLLGVFARVELIRSVLCRDAGRPELKCFDKHLFDQTPRCATSAKAILLNRQRKSPVAQRNCWTAVHHEVERRARAEFGLTPEPFFPLLAQNYWNHFTADSYRRDLLPAAAALGIRQVFVDNLKKSALTARAPLPGVFNWNMCCGHEYEIADELGGPAQVAALVRDARRLGITLQSWTNNDQALSSPLNPEADPRGWYVRLEDTRQKYGGAYAGVMSVLDLAHPDARQMFVDAHVRIKAQTGLDWYLFDSFYNLAFMPINYREGRPRTMWRGLLTTLKQLQDAGVHFTIESLGPFGSVQHGVHRDFNLENIFVCWRVGMGNGYTTVPTGAPLTDPTPHDPATLYYTLAHMALRHVPLFVQQQRIDQLWGAAHRQALADYHAAYDLMATRWLQEDGQSVIWHDAAQRCAVVFCFTAQRVPLPGRVLNLTTGQTLPRAQTYALQPQQTYVIQDAAALPTSLHDGAATAR